MANKIEEAFFQNYMRFFRLAEERRRWSIWRDIPWEQANPNTAPLISDIVEAFSAVEIFLPDYTSKILHLIRKSRGRAWFQANWGYEESKHSLTPGWDERARQIQEAGIYGPRQYLTKVYRPILHDLGLTKAELES